MICYNLVAAVGFGISMFGGGREMHHLAGWSVTIWWQQWDLVFLCLREWGRFTIHLDGLLQFGGSSGNGIWDFYV